MSVTSRRQYRDAAAALMPGGDAESSSVGRRNHAVRGQRTTAKRTAPTMSGDACPTDVYTRWRLSTQIDGVKRSRLYRRFKVTNAAA